MVTNTQLNADREHDCWAVLADKKSFHFGNSCVKRTLRRQEWQSTHSGNLVVPPTTYPQRWKNDAAIVQYLRGAHRHPAPTHARLLRG
jgi:hypothetical protein